MKPAILIGAALGLLICAGVVYAIVEHGKSQAPATGSAAQTSDGTTAFSGNNSGQADNNGPADLAPSSGASASSPAQNGAGTGPGGGAPDGGHREAFGAGGRGQGGGRMFAQLGLSEEQKTQIQQIRQTVTDRKQRREAIMAVLTPEQRTQWEQMRGQHRNGHGQQGGAQGAPAPASTPAPQ